ncbi:MAG: hypothetical protein A3D96_06365 [Chlamydiae bacterium RIFCSPHIGHO2_12_FULL_44_59]|nr:MAG: hypothetical protein A2796_06490 [Chlamydiae bacterium RIFCSPHIGHO2_01_FULL_44_39]OGN57631.1 MAG: hypothetical protein A3C42_04235 [Chlamydiae bacterium RIFCSPHIGHO2_02_FULL_45_9]OGN59644.1 MAG: hypothetical protein A3D96_06365 [Chlamydiae bacterium RIFCSPHIGHO2_12_FULL_44_59]OGN65734.1 MAG: hypothetical protein A2978_07360 [Chlamydiae bacterium RIFCSPLOWO2_01_FULL_44_52]OGN67876.1 MAG: hypothetical protein A3I67_05840 [Chlamydiae bacterium RIFCSPLOWO2_02_FULL_45_22]OGN69367.1 MAG: hyp
MITQLEELLQGLGKFLHLDLYLDQYGACTIQIHSTIRVQLQLDSTQENLWLFSLLTETPPGKFRENILKHALQTNARPDPCPGILGYILPTNQLALFHKFPIHILNGERLAGILGAFVEMAESWQKAIASGQSGPAPEPGSREN